MHPEKLDLEFIAPKDKCKDIPTKEEVVAVLVKFLRLFEAS